MLHPRAEFVDSETPDAKLQRRSGEPEALRPFQIREALRRLLVDAAYWAVGLEDKIPAKAEVDLVWRLSPPRSRSRITEGFETADLAK